MGRQSLVVGTTESRCIGGRPERFVLNRDAPFILLSIDAEGWSTLDFPSADAARSWLDEQDRDPHQRGGAYDWATITDPRTRLEDARW